MIIYRLLGNFIAVMDNLNNAHERQMDKVPCPVDVFLMKVLCTIILAQTGMGMGLLGLQFISIMVCNAH